ncbi:MAG: hypothetical protein O2968_01125 [Acidobacteria bacterium]|nr:hypothetical protein [Acidobacteriota bacterium]
MLTARQHAARSGMRLLDYYLMTNHAHLVAAPVRPAAFADNVAKTNLTAIMQQRCLQNV